MSSAFRKHEDAPLGKNESPPAAWFSISDDCVYSQHSFERLGFLLTEPDDVPLYEIGFSPADELVDDLRTQLATAEHEAAAATEMIKGLVAERDRYLAERNAYVSQLEALKDVKKFDRDQIDSAFNKGAQFVEDYGHPPIDSTDRDMYLEEILESAPTDSTGVQK